MGLPGATSPSERSTAFDHLFGVIENVATYGNRLGDEFTDDVGLSYFTKLIREPPYLKQRDGKSPFFEFSEHFYDDLYRQIWC